MGRLSHFDLWPLYKKTLLKIFNYNTLHQHHKEILTHILFLSPYNMRTYSGIERPDYTPDMISELKADEVFVFGSNLEGMHGGGDLFGIEKDAYLMPPSWP